MYYLSNFAFQEISSGALNRLDKNPEIWNKSINKRRIKRENEIVYDLVDGKKTGLPKRVNTKNYFSDLDTRFKNKARINLAKKIGILGGVGGLGYLGYRGYKKLNPENLEIGDETDREVLSKIGKGAKWAIGATASGKALDYARRGISYHYANNRLKNPVNLNTAQKTAYENIVKGKGALGEIKNNYNVIAGIGDIGNKAGKFWKRPIGKMATVGGLGLLGAGLYGYKKAKDYYLI